MKLKIFIIMITIVVIRFVLPEKTIAPTQKIEESKKTFKNVSVETFKTVDFVEDILFYSKTKPYKKVEYLLSNNRKIKMIYKREGDYVKKGDIIVELDTKDLEIEKRSIEIKIKSIQIELDSIDSLIKKKMESIFNYEKTLSNLEFEKSKLEKIKTDIKNSSIVAVFDGYLENFNLEIGEYLNDKKNISLVDNSLLEVEFYISSKNIEKIKNNQLAIVKTNGKILNGKVSFISKNAENESNTFLIKAIIENTFDLPSGMPATVSVDINEFKGIEISPFLLSSDEYGYYLKEIKNEVVKKLPVKIIKTSDVGVWVAINEKINRKIKIATLGHILIKVGDSIYEESK